MPSPIVFWGQTASTISLRADLKHTIDPKIGMTENDLSFHGNGIGAHGQDFYSFEIKFYDAIDPVDSFCRIIDRHVEFVVKKKVSKIWPRLLESSEKPGWLRVDFDKLEDSSDSDPCDEESANDWQRASTIADYLSRSRFESDANLGDANLGDANLGDAKLWDANNPRRKYQKMSPEDMRKIYLFLYNLFQLIGFLYLISALSLRQLIEGSLSSHGSYQVICDIVRLVHVLKILEVIHPILGFTKGDALYPSLEVGWRLFMILIMIESEPRIQTKPVTFYLISVWSLSDLIRYTYYMIRLFDADTFLKYAHYNVWIITYPLAFFFEGVILLRNIPYFDQTNSWSLDLPNHLNISFSMPLFIRIFLLIGFFPSSCMQLTRMYKKRKYRIGRKAKDD